MKLPFLRSHSSRAPLIFFVAHASNPWVHTGEAQESMRHGPLQWTQDCVAKGPFVNQILPDASGTVGQEIQQQIPEDGRRGGGVAPFGSEVDDAEFRKGAVDWTPRRAQWKTECPESSTVGETYLAAAGVGCPGVGGPVYVAVEISSQVTPNGSSW